VQQIVLNQAVDQFLLEGGDGVAADSVGHVEEVNAPGGEFGLRPGKLLPKSTRKQNRPGSALNFVARWSSRSACEQARNCLEARRECRREFFRVYRALGWSLESRTTKPGKRP
jgi:hypothetical protein